MDALLQRTNTNCCCGLFSLRRGIQIIALSCVLDGMWQVTAYFDAPLYFFGSDIRFGLEHHEQSLKLLSLAVGLTSLPFGAVGMRCTRRRRVRAIEAFQLFLGVRLAWSVVWSLFVGLPTSIVYIKAPIVPVWPFSKIPPAQHLVVDPVWPHGKPSLCVDFDDTLAALHADGFATWSWKGRLGMNYVADLLVSWYIDCDTVMQVFWLWTTLMFFVGGFCVHTAWYFKEVVRRGGDGESMYGSISDPVRAEQDVKAVVATHVRAIFVAMDKDGDGQLSLDELLEQVDKMGDLQA